MAKIYFDFTFIKTFGILHPFTTFLINTYIQIIKAFDDYLYL